jgi:hypothetical protein
MMKFKGFEISGRGLILRYYPSIRLLSGLPVFGLRYEPGTSRI